MREGYKMTEFGELPSDWSVITLDQVSKIVTGSTPKTSVGDYFGGEYPWVTPTDIKSQKNITQTERTLTKSGLNAARSIPRNSILVTCIASIGKNAILLREGSCNQQINAILPSDAHDSDYLFYYLEHQKDRLIKLSASTAVPIINKSTFEKFKVILPPLHEQRKIAEIFNAVDEKIELIETKIIQTTELKKGLMQQLLTKGIGHTHFKNSPLGVIPESWEVCKCSDLAEITSSKRIHQSDYLTTGIPFYRGKEISLKANGKKIEDLVFISETLFNEVAGKFGAPVEGDILITAVGTIGVSYLVRNGEKFYFKDGNLIWLRNINSTVDKPFLRYYLSSEPFQRIIDNISSGSSQKALTIVKFKELHIALPPVQEQAQIANILFSVDEKLDVLRTKREYFQELKKGLMQQLLTGKIRIANVLTKRNREIKGEVLTEY